MRISSSGGAKSERWWLLVGWLACLVGLGARLYHLTDQSFWLDEGFTHSFTKQPALDILRLTFGVEPNPPLYYLLLHYWIDLAGPTEFAMRYLSVVPSVLTIALVYRLGRDLGRPSVAGGAAILAAASPYLIWYGQEARMYALLAGLATASYVAVWRATTRKSPTRADWLLAGVLLTAMLYTHFYGVFVLASAALYTGFRWLQGERRASLRAPFGTFSLVGLAFLPWIVANLHPGPSWRASVDLGAIVGSSLAVFAHGGFLTGPLGTWLTVFEVILALAGIGAAIASGPVGRTVAAFLIAFLAVPALGIFALSQIQPIFTDHYVTAQAPVFYVAIATGVAWAFNRRPPVIVATYALAGAVSLVAIWTGWHDLRFRKEDFRAAASYIRAHGDPHDSVVLVAGFINYPFAYYFGSPNTVIPLDGTIGDVGAKLTPLLRDQDRVWLVVSHSDAIDPQDRVRSWLASRYPEVTEQFPKSVRVYGFRIASRREDVPPSASPTNVRFGDTVELAGIASDNNILPTDLVYHPPSNWIHVTLYWRALARTNAPYRSSVRLVDDRGVWADTLDRTNDALGRATAQDWEPGTIVVEDVDVNMNPVTPAGDFGLEVRLVGSDGKPVPIAEGNPRVATIHVEPTPVVPRWEVPLRRFVESLQAGFIGGPAWSLSHARESS